MRCEKSRRWISDQMDGALSAARARPLEAHLRGCAACRAYRSGLETLQTKAKSAARPVRTPEDWQKALRGLADKIREAPAPGRVRTAPSFFPPRQWAWAGAASILAIGAILYFLLAPAGVQEVVSANTFEEGWGQIARQIGDDEVLAATFSTSLKATLNESFRDIDGEVLPLLDNQAIFLEDLSDEEVLILNDEIVKVISE